MILYGLEIAHPQWTLNSSAWAHAWRGQEVVLFVTYDLSGDQVNLTIGLPAALTTSFSTRSRQELNATTPSLAYLSSLTQELLDQVKQGSVAWFDDHETLPKLEKVDVIFKAMSQPTSDNKEREIHTIGEVQLELHSGNQDAIVMRLTYDKVDPRKLKKARLMWRYDRWFVRNQRGLKRQDQSQDRSSTKEAPGLIIDQDGITPITFYPHEPEVIWRAAHHFESLKLQQNPHLTQRSKKETVPPWWSWAYWFGENSTGASPKDHAEIFKSLHRKIYSAFDHHHDEVAYQELSNVLSDELLDRVFQTTYNALILRDQGGARAQVTHVIPLELKNLAVKELPIQTQAAIEKLSKVSVFSTHEIYRYQWRVIGEVRHWEHTHRRVNDYEAIYLMAKRSEGWRLIYVEAISQRRRPELEGSL